jgi:hypothetical protein
LTATASRLAGVVAPAVRLLVGAIAMGAATACSAASAEGSSDAAASVPEVGPPCLLCRDASFDGPLAVEVRGTLDQVCGNADGCHGGGTGNFGIHIGSEFTDMINVTSSENPPMKRVLPGDPLQSYVYLKLRCEGGIVGACMPAGNPDPETAKLFHDWIEAGAPTQ